MEFNDKEIDRLLRCTNERMQTLRDELAIFNVLKKAAIKGTPIEDRGPIIKSCNDLIEFDQQEYSDLISIRTKLIRGEENDS